MHDDQVNVNSTPKDWSIFKLRPTASTYKVPQTSVVQSLAKTKPLRSILAKDFKEQPNNFRQPGLQPVSPRSQIRMELEAGMKPSLPSHQQAKQFNLNPFPVVPNNNNDERRMRPILGRKFNESQTNTAADTPFLKTYKEFCG